MENCARFNSLYFYFLRKYISCNLENKSLKRDKKDKKKKTNSENKSLVLCELFHTFFFYVMLQEFILLSYFYSSSSQSPVTFTYK